MHQWEEAKTKINLIFQNNVNKYFFLKTLSMIVIFPLILQKRIPHIGFVYWLTHKQWSVAQALITLFLSRFWHLV